MTEATAGQSAPGRPGLERGGLPVLGAAVVIMAASAPGQTVGISVFVDHLMADLDLSRSALSTAYLLGTACGALSMPAAGRLVDRRGFRWATTWFGGAFAVVLVAMAGVTGFVTLVAGFAFTRMLGQGALTLVSTTTVASWFDRSRGTALGLLTAIGGGLMSLMPVAIALVISAGGWRRAWIVLGVTVAAVLVPLGRFVVRDRRPVVTSARPGGPPNAVPGAGVADVLRRPAFWVVAGAVALAAAYGTALMFHQIALLTARGLSEAQAAANFVPQTLTTAAAALTVGHLADHISPRWLLVGATFGVGVAGLGILAVTDAAGAVAYGAALGASGGAIRTLEGAVVARWFGTARLGELRGIVLGAAVAGSAVGPLVLALSNDLTGSYTPGITGFAVLAAGLAVAGALVPVPVSHGHR